MTDNERGPGKRPPQQENQMHPDFISLGSDFTDWPTFTCDRCERAFTGTAEDAHEHVEDVH